MHDDMLHDSTTWINDKSNNIYKTKRKETIHTLFLQYQILKTQKRINDDE